jgi:hypothetical protein
MEGTSNSTSEIARVAVRLPSFWAERFTQAETQFHLPGISNELPKFYHVISQLDEKYVAEVENIINSPPRQDSYTTFKTELVKQLCPSRGQRTRQLFTLEDMGDRKPSQFLRHLKSLAPDIPENYLRILWTSRLSTNIRTILAGMPEVELDASALCADRMMETVSPSTVASTSPGPDYTELLQNIRDLTRRLANVVTEKKRSNSNERQFNFRDRRSNSNSRSSSTRRSPSRRDSTNTLCWYHQRYGDRAQRCS